jgi:hypothetical protein
MNNTYHPEDETFEEPVPYQHPESVRVPVDTNQTEMVSVRLDQLFNLGQALSGNDTVNLRDHARVSPVQALDWMIHVARTQFNLLNADTEPEPSDAERAAWGDATRSYVESLEKKCLRP